MSSSPESVKRFFCLNGKKAIVTGGGGGIGSVIAEGLAELGVDVALLDLKADAIEAVRRRIEERFPIKVLTIPVDIRNSEEIEVAVKKVVKEFGCLDILVNCHGVAQWMPAEDISDEDWNRVLDVNLKGVFLMCQAVGRRMIEKGNGKIVNLASMSASIVNKPQPQAHYNASKAGVVMLTKSLAAEWAKHNINVNCVSPNYTLTPMVEDLLKTQPQYERLWLSLVPMGRLAKPIDIVGPVLFLVSDAAAYVTGHDVVVDGGYTVW